MSETVRKPTCQKKTPSKKKYTPENQDRTQKSPNWKGKSSSKPPFFGSMLIFRGVLSMSTGTRLLWLDWNWTISYQYQNDTQPNSLLWSCQDGWLTQHKTTSVKSRQLWWVFFSCSLNWVSIKSTKNISQKIILFLLEISPQKKLHPSISCPSFCCTSWHPALCWPLPVPRLFVALTRRVEADPPAMSVIVVGQGFLYRKKQVWKQKKTNNLQPWDSSEYEFQLEKLAHDQRGKRECFFLMQHMKGKVPCLDLRKEKNMVQPNASLLSDTLVVLGQRIFTLKKVGEASD